MVRLTNQRVRHDPSRVDSRATPEHVAKVLAEVLGGYAGPFTRAVPQRLGRVSGRRARQRLRDLRRRHAAAAGRRRPERHAGRHCRPPPSRSMRLGVGEDRIGRPSSASGAREGWHVRRTTGAVPPGVKLFELYEFWIENRVMLRARYAEHARRLSEGRERTGAARVAVAGRPAMSARQRRPCRADSPPRSPSRCSAAASPPARSTAAATWCRSAAAGRDHGYGAAAGRPLGSLAHRLADPYPGPRGHGVRHQPRAPDRVAKARLSGSVSRA